MPFTADDLSLIKGLRLHKMWGAKKMLHEFPNKPWTKGGLDKILSKIDNTGNATRRVGSGRPLTVRNAENIDTVNDLIVSDDDEPGTHLSVRQIARQTGISRSSIQRIVKKDLRLPVFKRLHLQRLNVDHKQQRVQKCQQLLNRFPTDNSIRIIWFTDEKSFTIETPINSQNDRVYGREPGIIKRNLSPNRLIATRNHFSKSIMVSVGISMMGKTEIAFVEPGVKCNSTYYCNHLLLRKLFPNIRAICNDDWILQQDGAPAHRSRQTISFLQRHTPDFIEPTMWPACSPDLNPVDYSIWGALQQKIYMGYHVDDLADLRQRITNVWNAFPQTHINACIGQWRARLQAVINNNGSHIEHQF